MGRSPILVTVQGGEASGTEMVSAAFWSTLNLYSKYLRWLSREKGGLLWLLVLQIQCMIRGTSALRPLLRVMRSHGEGLIRAQPLTVEAVEKGWVPRIFFKGIIPSDPKTSHWILPLLVSATGNKPRASHTPGKCPTTEPYPQLLVLILFSDRV